MVSGHFHTLTYQREILAEMWQKQSGSAGEEKRIVALRVEACGHPMGSVVPIAQPLRLRVQVESEVE